jgi:hypothetical protein
VIYDVQQLDDNLDGEMTSMEEPSETPVMGRATIDGEEREFDLLGLEYEEDANVMYINLGPRR